MSKALRLLAAWIVIAVSGLAWAPGASAGPDTCVGFFGAMTTDTRMGLLGIHPVAHGDFYLDFTQTAGGCASSLTGLTATGKIDGFCYASSGHGVATAHGEDHRFAFVNMGFTFWFTGEVTGTLMVFESPNDTPSCLQGNNTTFMATGQLTLAHSATCAHTDVPSGPYTMHTMVC